MLFGKKKQDREEYEIQIDKENEDLINHFCAMCQERNIKKAKLTRGKFKAFLTIRYKGAITDKIVNYFDPFFRDPMSFEFFCEAFERLMNPQNAERIKKMVLQVYDFNDDKYVDELDVYCFMQHYEVDNPELYLSVYIEDVILIIKQLEYKKKLKRFENRDMDLKLQKIH